MYRRYSLLCPNCGRLIAFDESECPYCGLRNPRWRSRFRRFDPSLWNPVRSLVLINVFMFVISLLIVPENVHNVFTPFSFLSPSDGSLFLLGATGTIPIIYFGRWWTLITACFLHGGFLHILFNMIALYHMGPFVEREYGFYRFITIYLISGIGGFFLSLIAGVKFTIGASASICGLIGAILYYGKSRGDIWGEFIYRQAMGWVVGLVLLGLLMPGINNWAHVGGLISGVIMSALLGHEGKVPESFWHRVIGIILVVITAITIVGNLLAVLFRVFVP
ncbi:MAG: rhomboid family intramembrane serine protease [Syntrophales bacterium]|nr:rhomboid family intramembrane serine protease [Syntrophales bacterium]